MKTNPFPSRAVNIVMPNLAGFAPDIVVRLIAAFLSDLWAQPVDVENCPGIAQVDGTRKVIDAAPDGYTLLGNSNSHVSIPIIYNDLPYKVDEDLTEIAMLGESSFVMLTASVNAWQTLQEFVEAAKAKPAHFSFPTLGIGYATHFAAAYFNQVADLDLTTALTPQEQDALAEVLSGRAAYFMVPENVALRILKNTQFKALAITGKSRSANLPMVPTIAESGYPQFEKTIWFGIWAPAATPVAIKDQLHANMQTAICDPTIQRALSTAGIMTRPMTMEQFRQFVRTEVVHHQEIARKGNIPVGLART